MARTLGARSVIGAREAVRLIGADWSASGSMLLGVNALALSAIGFMLAPATRASVVTLDDLAAEPTDVRADVETLVSEIQEAYRRQHPAPSPLMTWDVIRAAVLRHERRRRSED